MSASLFNDSNIKFWIDNNMNVLLKGKHGIGKSMRVLQAFKEANLRYQYISAATMDPWVDFIGIPQKTTDPVTGKSYLELVKPKIWENNEIQVLFLDEFNRSNKKVRNAVMELIQFKSINGNVFPNLRMVWAAINPDEDETQNYDVERLDPAQADRFQVQVSLPYKPDATYFRAQYGRPNADAAIDWWGSQLSDKQKDMISPRRLDYILAAHKAGGDIRAFVPEGINMNQLLSQLKNGPIADQLKILFEAGDKIKSKKFLSDENNLTNSEKLIVANNDYVKFFLPLINDEKLVGLMTEHGNVAKYVFDNYPTFKGVVMSVNMARSGALGAQAAECIVKNHEIALGPDTFRGVGNTKDYNAKLTEVEAVVMNVPGNRVLVYKALVENVPTAMTVPQAKKTLTLLGSILNMTTEFSQFPRLDELLTHSMRILKAGGVNWKDVVPDAKVFINKHAAMELSLKSSTAPTI